MIGVSLACFLWASSYYKVPTSLLLSIAQVEGGRVGTVSANTNGTQDLGPMQINTIWLDDIARRTGQNPAQVRQRLVNDGCYNVSIGAWILQKNINSTGNPWLGAAYYHSRTPALAKRYLAKVHARHQIVSPQLQALYRQNSGQKAAYPPPQQAATPTRTVARPTQQRIVRSISSGVSPQQQTAYTTSPRVIRSPQSTPNLRPVQQGQTLRAVRYVQPLAQPAGSMSARTRAPDQLALGQGGQQ